MRDGKYRSLGCHFPHVILACAMLFLSACATQSYRYDDTPSAAVSQRASTRTNGELTVAASVPGRNEAEAIFGVPLYDRGIQPVWLKIVNRSPEPIRFAPTGIDRDYFSPLEVAYMHRKGMSKEARREMDRRFYQSALPRQIPAGETRSGYVFTHASPGTKSFNVDLFGSSYDYSFAFFVAVPGFIPDHAAIDFPSLYAPSEVVDHDLDGARRALLQGPLLSTDRSGQKAGLPVGLALVGKGLDVRKALLRAGWYESASVTDEDQISKAQYLFGRMPDAIFRKKRNQDNERNKLFVWLAPMRINGQAVWLAQVSHSIGRRTQFEQAIFGARVDPDVDDGRDFFIQNMWYSQSLQQITWLTTGQPIPFEDSRVDFNGSGYFTDGKLAMAWLSGVPISLTETRILE
jgi:hypothetical protein